MAINHLSDLDNIPADWDSGTIDSQPVDCIFDKPPVVANEVQTEAPSTAITDAVQATVNATRGSVFVYNGVSYTVVNIWSNGVGMTILDLEEA